MRPVALAAGRALLALNLTLAWSQMAQPIKSDFRAAAAFVTARQQPDDLLLFQIPHIRHTYVYYGGEPARWLDGPYTNNEMTQIEVDRWMAQGTSGAKALWLIASETAIWDERRLTTQWLETHGTRADHADFARVAVTRYEMNR